ncbi:MAG: hypothetical protein HY661_07360 [Betaproteobacteria bacterium]|nr:hypothetical protein [Betaproteobacteria bacterium]
MQEMTAQSWKRRGCSIVWSPELLTPLITDADATPLRTVLEWEHHGLPESPPGGSRTVLVGGLQTVLEVMPDTDTAYAWLRENILSLCRRWCNHWGNVGLVFGMDGPGKLFQLNEADDLVYFGKGSDRDTKLCLTRAIWNGAATGTGVFKLITEGTKEIGGFHVKHLS